jgi:hypothetical protein
MPHLSRHPDCRSKTKLSIRKVMCRAIQAGGEPAFEAYKTAHNAFVGTLVGIANTIVAIIKPILEIDKIVIDTFVRPPLDATVKVLEATVKTVKIPLRIIGSLDGTGECGAFHGRLRNLTNKASTFLTRDFNKLRNVADTLDEWLGDREELIEDLEALAELVAELEITDTYEEFVNTICPTISQ